VKLRKGVFSGSWYPERASACEAQINQFLSQVDPDSALAREWLGGIVPHAGWRYSGSIACQVINRLKSPQPIDLVVIFGMHLHPAASNYMMAEGGWQTPFGALKVEGELAAALLQRFGFQVETPDRFTPDNTIELQLPFVKYLLDPEHVLTIGVPPTPSSLEIGHAIADWAKTHGKRLKIIGSTDLTHYGPNYGFAPQGIGPRAVEWVREHNDRNVIEAILAMDPGQVIAQGLEHQNACCAGAAATAIAAAKRLGATRAQSVAYASSYDISPSDSFVGYAGVLLG
jgi:MEMO1 family protein